MFGRDVIATGNGPFLKMGNPALMGGVSRALLIELPSCAGPFIRASMYGGDLQSPSHFFGKNLSTSSGLWAFRLGFKKLHSKRCTLGLELRKATLNLCPWQML